MPRLPIPSSFAVTLANDGTSAQLGYRDGAKVALEMSWRVDDVRLRDGSLVGHILLFGTCAVGGAVVLRSFPRTPEMALIFVFAALSAALALVCAYLLLLALTNRTHLTIRDGVLRVRHAPLPWSGETAVRVGEIDRLFCARNRAELDSFMLNARLRSGEVRPLVSRLDRPFTAVYLQQRVEDAL